MYRNKIILFLIAAFSMTQIRIVGYIGISEFVLLLCGPFVLIKNWNILKRDGFAPVLMLAALWVASAIITDYYRENSIHNLLRGLAAPLSVLFMIPCIHWLLRDDIRLIKWAIIGFTVTTFLSTYVIQAGTSVGAAEELGISAREAAENYKLTFMVLVMSVVSLVPTLAYLKVPILSTLVTIGLAIFGLLQGGRSMFLALLASAGMLFVAGGNVNRIRHASKIFPFMVVILLIFSYAAKEVYEYSAIHGYMGEDELKKYEVQSSSKIGVMSGRGQIFPVFFAICDSPILGHGSWALDYQGYALSAAEWLNDDVAIEAYYSQPGIDLIPGHSHILTAYVWHGIFGAIFWCYVLWVLWRTFRSHLGEVPELYGYLAYTLPSLLWAILFSPFGGRVSTTTAIVVCLLLNNMHKTRKGPMHSVAHQ